MKIKLSRRYIKQYAKLDKKKKTSVDVAIKKFINNPFDKSLYNHPLKGKRSKSGQRSISAEPDLRILFEVDGDYGV
ncbi:MAG: hypothetical protein H8E98_07880 [Bacteroidetes bacterium]|nr:hypothetical protein [Bacteroidota bacterium]